MKILYFTRGQSPHDLRFLTAQAQTEHQVAVLCLEHDPKRTWPLGINVLSWNAPAENMSWLNSGKFALAFQQVVQEFKPDVVHAGPIQKVAYIAALAGVKPLVSMSWGSDLLREADENLWSRWVTRFTLKRTTLLAADCQTVVDKARSFGFTGPVKVFPWGVDLQHFKPGRSGVLRKQLGWENQTVFLSNRTMEELYGVEIIAWAFINACQDNEELRLLMFGKGSQEAKLHALIEKAGLSDRVYFGGQASLEELPDIYCSADYYVSASHSDGSSVSLMEALACGIPVIVSNILSNREWIQNNQQGWLFSDGSAIELSNRMVEASLCKNRDAFAEQCRTLAEARADWKINFAKLLDAYSEAIELAGKQ